MQAVITTIGEDKVGILAKVATVCADAGVNICEVTQSILGGTFAMIMLADLERCAVSFGELSARLQEAGHQIGVEVNITRQELFDAMHRI